MFGLFYSALILCFWRGQSLVPNLTLIWLVMVRATSVVNNSTTRGAVTKRTVDSGRGWCTLTNHMTILTLDQCCKNCPDYEKSRQPKFSVMLVSISTYAIARSTTHGAIWTATIAVPRPKHTDTRSEWRFTTALLLVKRSILRGTLPKCTKTGKSHSGTGEGSQTWSKTGDTLLDPHLHITCQVGVEGNTVWSFKSRERVLLFSLWQQNYPCWYRSREGAYENHQHLPKSNCAYPRAVLASPVDRTWASPDQNSFHTTTLKSTIGWVRKSYGGNLHFSSPLTPPCVKDLEWIVDRDRVWGPRICRGWNLLCGGSWIIRAFHPGLVLVQIVWGKCTLRPVPLESRPKSEDSAVEDPRGHQKHPKNNIKTKPKK